jgi:hypothetical protein
MKILAIGPETGAPSWDWVGLGMADELARYFRIVLFKGFEEIPNADLILIVKQRPPAAFVGAAKAKGARVCFAPIDVYRDPEEIAADAAMLGECNAVLLHSEALRPALTPFCSRLAFVEHHARYALADLATFKAEGFLLWIGALQHVPHVISWLERNPPPVEVRLLTDLNARSARLAAHVEAHEQGFALRIRNGKINGYPVEPWSEAAQAKLMQGCKAAIDIKGSSFSQATKPPAKAQQFVASGIPFGCNPGHPAAAYFRSHGFEAADARDFDRLLSHAYWAETRRFAGSLRELTARGAVGRVYRQVLEGTDIATLPSPREGSGLAGTCVS